MRACTVAAETAHELGLGVNAGHDLDHRNLVRFRELPHLDEVSIGHALISRALFDGLSATVRAYLDVCGLRMTKESVALGVAGVLFGFLDRVDHRRPTGAARRRRHRRRCIGCRRGAVDRRGFGGPGRTRQRRRPRRPSSIRRGSTTCASGPPTTRATPRSGPRSATPTSTPSAIPKPSPGTKRRSGSTRRTSTSRPTSGSATTTPTRPIGRWRSSSARCRSSRSTPRPC